MRRHDGGSSLRVWAALKGALSIAALCLALVGTVISALLLLRAEIDNRSIDALAAGKDRPVGASAGFEVKFARAQFLLRHDRLEEAQSSVDAVGAGGKPIQRAALNYNMANARLRAAFTLIEQNKIDAAAANVRLAKEGYRRALALEPQYWDAKYNLDVAMRLVRDFPQMEAEVLQEPPVELPKRLWTDLPRLPRGLP